MTKEFASRADLAEKQVTFEQLSEHAYAYTTEGDPNTGVVIGDDAVMVIDAQATPVMAEDVIRRIRQVTDKPIKHVVLTHYHAVRVLGASAYKADNVIASAPTLELIRERGAQDMKSEIGRFPRLFQAVESIPGLTWPTLVFEKSMTLWLGSLEVRIIHAGRGHTQGDTIVWLPKEKVLFSGDLVEYQAGVYCGDAHLADWPKTLDYLLSLKPSKLVPGRGPAMKTPGQCVKAVEYTRSFVTGLYQAAKKGVARKQDLRQVYAATRKAMDPTFGKVPIYEHCMPFDVSRAFDEASGLDHPRIWTAKRDIEMWKALEA